MATSESSKTIISPAEGSRNSTVTLTTYSDGTTSTNISKINESPSKAFVSGNSNTFTSAMGVDTENIFRRKDATSQSFLNEIYENEMDRDENAFLDSLIFDFIGRPALEKKRKPSFIGQDIASPTGKKAEMGIMKNLIGYKKNLIASKAQPIGKDVVSPEAKAKGKNGISAVSNNIPEEKEPGEEKKMFGMPKKTAIIVIICLVLIIAAVVYFAFFHKKK